MRQIKAVCLALASLLMLAATAAKAEPLTIRMGYVQLPGHLGPILFQDNPALRAVLKHYGESYVVDPIRFRGTTPRSRLWPPRRSTSPLNRSALSSCPSRTPNST